MEVIESFLLLVLSLVLAFVTVGGTPDNLAAGKSVTVSGLSAGSDVAGVTVDGSTAASYSTSTSTQCTGCFIAQNDEKKWWRVDLGKEYFLTGINLHTGKSSYLLKTAEILSTSSRAWSKIESYRSRWNTVYSITMGSSTIRHLIQPAVTARYVAVFAEKEGSIYLSEVEIYGYEINSFKPTEYSFADVGSSSITLEWRPPDRNGTIEVDYEYKCSDGDTWTDIGNVRTIRHTGLTTELFAAGVTCTLRVKGFESTSVSQTLLCSDDFPPKNFQLGSPERKYEQGRRRWMYKIRWEPPGDYDCRESTNPYKLEIMENGKIAKSRLVSSKYYNLWVDGAVNVKVTVQLRNRNGILSKTLSTSFTTSTDIAPQVAPRNVGVVAASTVCVTVSWQPVLYPNGPESQLVYQVSCNGSEWKAVASGSKVCGYQPNTRVEYGVQARREGNNIGHQNSAVKTAYAVTECSAPSVPGISIGKSFTQNETVSLVIIWQAAEPYCDTIKSYNLGISANNKFVFQQSYEGDVERKATVEVEPSTKYTVTLKAVNNEGLQSQTNYLIVETPQLDCGPPPEVENAKFSTNSGNISSSLNATVIYECIGSIQTDGSNTLQCIISDGRMVRYDGDMVWDETVTVCSNKGQREIPLTVIAGAVSSSVFLLLVIIFIVLCIVKRRKKESTSAQKPENPSDDHSETSPVEAEVDYDEDAAQPQDHNAGREGYVNVSLDGREQVIYHNAGVDRTEEHYGNTFQEHYGNTFQEHYGNTFQEHYANAASFRQPAEECELECPSTPQPDMLTQLKAITQGYHKHK